MFALPISMPCFKNINFLSKIPKIKLFLQKNANFFVCWVLRPQTLVPPAAGPRPSASGGWGLSFFCCSYVILHKLILRLAGNYGFPQAALSLSKFVHPLPNIIENLLLFSQHKEVQYHVLSFLCRRGESKLFK